MTTCNLVTPSLGTDMELVPHNLHTMGADAIKDYDHRLHRMGTKYRPIMMDDVQVHPDSLAVEFAIRTPADDPLDFIMAYQSAKSTAERMIGTTLIGVDWVDIDEVVGLTEADTPFLWENSRVFGCSPDWIVMSKHRTARLRDHVPSPIKTRSLKELGGHLHFTLPLHLRAPEITLPNGEKSYDGAAIAPLVMNWYERTQMFHTWDHPTEGPWYRKPMVFRPKPYGFEYRSFGASVLDSQQTLEALAREAFDFMEDCFDGRIHL